MAAIFNLFLIILKIIIYKCVLLQNFSNAQSTSIILEQGALVGLKVFPESSRTPVYAFLGIPYAEPPVGDLRFSPPKPHNSWNWTLQAMSMKPICPQLSDTIYDEMSDGLLARPADMSEDCLYLNIWVPEAGIRFGNLPVLAIMTGEEMSYDWPRNRATGLDFASEGVVVVTIQYRSNIFGWLNLDNQELSGNYGLLDQELALKWIQHNIQNFGGLPSQITLLGHGTSGGGICAMAHILRRNEGLPLFANAILMSAGDIERVLDASTNVLDTSRVLVQKLGCQFEERGQQVVSCLRMKSVSDLQKAYESVYEHGNGTLKLGPTLERKFRDIIKENGSRLLPPLMIGITSNEGAFLQHYWLELAREDYQAIRAYVNYTVLPSVLSRYNIATNSSQIMDALNWRYFSGEAAVNVPHLLNAMQRLISESHYETPFYQILELLSNASNRESSRMQHMNIYAYIFDTTNAMDMRGKLNLFGGASHSSDLPLLLGPGLFQQISRRRFTADEDQLCRKLRTAFVNFIKSGNPTPGRMYDAWLPYSKEHKFIYNLGENISKSMQKSAPITQFDTNLAQIEKLLEIDRRNVGGVGLSRSNRHEYNNAYQQPSDRVSSDGRGIKSTTYNTRNQQDSGYALHLKRVYGFWQVLLPNMAMYGVGDGDGNFDKLNDAFKQRTRFMEASADAARYKQGFFAMLGLVTLLLAILCVCVYLLRRDPLGISASSGRERFCL